MMVFKSPPPNMTPQKISNTPQYTITTITYYDGEYLILGRMGGGSYFLGEEINSTQLNCLQTLKSPMTLNPKPSDDVYNIPALGHQSPA